MPAAAMLSRWLRFLSLVAVLGCAGCGGQAGVPADKKPYVPTAEEKAVAPLIQPLRPRETRDAGIRLEEGEMPERDQAQSLADLKAKGPAAKAAIPAIREYLLFVQKPELRNAAEDALAAIEK